VRYVARSASVPYAASQMYALVADIPSYPLFLPWCRDSQVLSTDGDQVVASLEISFKGLNKTFTTLNRTKPFELIEMELVAGPFSHLQGYWKFIEQDQNTSKISLNMEYDFSSRFLSAVFGPVFGQIANSLVEAFRRRAGELYG